MSRLMDDMHVVAHTSTFVASYADFFEGPGSGSIVYTDVFNLAKYRKVLFIIQLGAGATGTGVVTVESCDNVTPDTPTAIAFNYKAMTTSDTWGTTTSQASTGFTTATGADKCYMVEVDASELSGTNHYVRLKITEGTDSPCDGCVLTILGDPRYQDDVPVTAIA